MRNKYTRAMAIAFFIIAISFFNFTSLDGNENVSSIQIVTLLVCGMGIGVFLVNLFVWLRERRNQDPS